MARKRRRPGQVVLNPLRSRSKWAVRGRAVAHFTCSLLGTVLSYLWCWLLLPLIKAVWSCLCAIGRAIRNRRHVEPEAPLPASPATKHKAPTKLDIVREESVSGLVSMGETRKMAEMRVDNVMAEHPELDATEDVIKAVFQAQ